MESVASPPGWIPPSVVVNMISSTDGISWSRLLPPISRRNYRRVEYGNGRFVAAGIEDIFGTLTDANDPKKWVQWSSGTNVISGLGFGRNMFLGLGKGTIFVSAEGVTWRIQQTGHPAALYDVAFGQRTFVAVGENGTILQSRVFPAEAAIALKDPAWSNGVFRASIQTDATREYSLEFKNALDEPAWTPLPFLGGTGSALPLSDTDAFARQRFYRVRIR